MSPRCIATARLEDPQRGCWAAFTCRAQNLMCLLAMLIVSPASSMAADPALLNQNQRIVSKMSQLERDRLQRSQAEFAQMTETQRAHYRELQRQLDEDRSIGGSLTNLLATYSAWLQTLTPGQREELFRETDSAKKLALVRKFKDEQDHPVNSAGSELPEIAVDGFPGRFFAGPAPLSPQDLRAVMKVLVDELPAEEMNRFEKADRAEQYREIVRLSLRHSPGGPRDWPSRELQDRMLNAIESRTQKEFFKKRPEAQRDVLVRQVFFGIMHQAAEETKSKWPHRSDLEQVFRELDQETKQNLLQRPQREMNEELVRRYFEKRGDNTHRNLMDLKNELAREMGKLGLLQHPPQEPGAGFGPFRGGPGDRPGLGRERDGGRPGDRPPPPPRPRGDKPDGDRPPND